MSNEPDRMKSIFLAVVDLPADERVTYLDKACADDVELRRRINELLQAHDAIDGFLGPSRCAPTGESFASENAKSDATISHRLSTFLPGLAINDRYVLTEKIGEGGMGEVWAAKQTSPIKRRVAIKLIRQGMNSTAVLARFEQERQALALMDHPNIARVLDAGISENGQPYFVMELVSGLPITKFCDEMTLSLNDRLALFVSVCNAVQHAHQKGIVHRDLKPSNILVTMIDGIGIPKVIDFGVAKATAGKLTDITLDTQFGAVVGTVEFMSPEQAGFSGQDIDTRADIYSLGVILYELLTGLRPHDAKQLGKHALAEILRVIVDGEPPKPSTRISTDDAIASLAALRRTDPRSLTAVLRGDLDWIVMKCLEKQRDRRYETANGLARDILRYLAYEPVEAKPPSASYRAIKFLRRHQIAVLALSAILTAVLLGATGTTIGLIRETLARKTAEIERGRAEAFRDRALATLRATTNEDVTKLIGERPELGMNERTYLEAVASRWQAFAEEEGIEASTRLLAGEAHFQIGKLWQYLGRLPDARKEFEMALSIHEQLLPSLHTPEVQHHVASDRASLARVLTELGDQAKAQSLATSTRSQLQKLLEGDSKNVPYRELIGDLESTCASSYEHTGNLEDALNLHRLALQTRQQLADEFPHRVDYQHKLAGSHSNVAMVLHDHGKQHEAMESYHQALQIEESLFERFPDEPMYQMFIANISGNICDTLLSSGKIQAARESGERARDLRKRLVTTYSGVFTYKSMLLRSHIQLSNVLEQLGQLAGAEVEQRAAEEITRQITPESANIPHLRHQLAECYGNLGAMLAERARYEESLLEYDRAIKIAQELTTKHPDTPKYERTLAILQMNQGRSLLQLGRFDDALVILADSITHAEHVVKVTPDDPSSRALLGYDYFSLATAYGMKGEMEQAEATFSKARELYKTLVGDYPGIPKYRDSLANFYDQLAVFYIERQDLGRAHQEIEQAIAIRRSLVADYPSLPEYNSGLARSQVELARILARNGKIDQFNREIADAFDRYSALSKEFSENSDYFKALGQIHNTRGNALLRNGQRKGAMSEFRAATAVFEQLVAKYPEVAENRYQLANASSTLSLCLPPGEEARRLLESAVGTAQELVDRNPSQQSYRVLLGGACCNLGRLFTAMGQPMESLPWYDRAVNALKDLAENRAQIPQAIEFYSTTLGNRAQLFMATEQYPEAVADLEALHQVRPEYQANIDFKITLIFARLRAGKVDAALSDAERIDDTSSLTAEQCYYLACLYAKASTVDDEQSAKYANRAVALLQQGIESGFRDTKMLRESADLKPLEQHPDFQMLLRTAD